MTERKRKTTRRRFLADPLFLGGGVSAASLLAKSQPPPDGRELPPEVLKAETTPSEFNPEKPVSPPGESTEPQECRDDAQPKCENKSALPSPQIEGKPMSQRSGDRQTRHSHDSDYITQGEFHY